jgi:hypothetical protein
MQVGTEASRYSGGSGQKDTSSGRMMLVSVWHPDGMTRRPDGWNSEQMSVRTANRESEIFYLFRSAESYENALTSGIPVYNIFTHN